MSSELQQQIELSIEQSNQLLDAFEQFHLDNSDENLEKINSLSAQRDIALRELFSQHQPQALGLFSQQLKTIGELDKQLLSIANAQKSNLVKKVLKQKKNTKATNAYLSK